MYTIKNNFHVFIGRYLIFKNGNIGTIINAFSQEVWGSANLHIFSHYLNSNMNRI